jgi:type IV pilus assembly protein PilF
MGVAMVVGAVAACSSSPPAENDKPSRANDPMSDLSASQVFTQKGVRYMESGLYDVALKDLEKAVELDDDNSEAYNALGVLYERLDKPDQADKAFRRALSLQPDNYGARNNFGRFLCARGKFPEAFQQFRQVIGTKLYNQPWIPLTNAGVCARTAGRLAEAEVYLRQALDANPSFPPALLEMARLNRERGQNLQARAFLQRYAAVAGPSRESLQLGIEVETALGNSQAAEDYGRKLRSVGAPNYPRVPSKTGGGT